MVEPPGTAPGSISSISQRVYRHSQIALTFLIIGRFSKKSKWTLNLILLTFFKVFGQGCARQWIGTSPPSHFILTNSRH